MYQFRAVAQDPNDMLAMMDTWKRFHHQGAGDDHFPWGSYAVWWKDKEESKTYYHWGVQNE